MKMSFMKTYELPVLTGKFIGLNAFLGTEDWKQNINDLSIHLKKLEKEL